jgi:N-terminal domain of CBF1 interacting co-repressor CIR
MQNQERLWKAEEEAAAEQRSLAELRKKIEDERGREELRQAAIAGGHQKCVNS